MRKARAQRAIDTRAQRAIGRHRALGASYYSNTRLCLIRARSAKSIAALGCARRTAGLVRASRVIFCFRVTIAYA